MFNDQHSLRVVECSIPEGMTIGEYRASRVPTDIHLDAMPSRLQRGWMAAMLIGAHNQARRAQSKDALA